MIKKFINKLLGKSAPAAASTHLASAWRLARKSTASTPPWSTSAPCNVVRTLKQAGFEAYIVGGAVRDLLLGLRAQGL